MSMAINWNVPAVPTSADDTTVISLVGEYFKARLALVEAEAALEGAGLRLEQEAHGDRGLDELRAIVANWDRNDWSSPA